MQNRYGERLFGRKVLLVRMLVLAALILAPASAFAWMDEEPRSFSLTSEAKRLEVVQRKALPKVEPEVLLAQDEADRKDLRSPQPLRFAVADETVFTLKNSGTWQSLPDGRLWRLRLHSPGAVSHNLGITRFDMTKGSKLWIYDPEQRHVEGPYMARHRSHQGSLWTPIIEGDEIVVEVFVPTGVAKPFLELRANQGYRGFFGTDKAIPGAGVAGSCNNNVVCPISSGWWPFPVQAVGAYTRSGIYFCSGTRLNNPAPRKEYFLTADHCGITSTNASTVVVYWNYQSPTCTPTGSGSTAQNQTGSVLRARHAASDFALIELSSSPPAAWDVRWSGWDNTSVAPASTAGIHHPQGDVKKFSTSSTPAQSVFYGTAPNPSGDHWRANWSSGVTEGGSSGSCLFDATTQRCVGQLHGGASYCGAPAGAMWDDYGKFSVSWIGGGTAATRLMDWLDPASTGLTYMNGDPHLANVDGIRYDFQGAGEYVALRDKDGVEIQARTLPVSTNFSPYDPYDGLATCASLISAVALKVDGHRVTIQPNLSGFPDPTGLQVRVDGVLTSLGSGAVPVGRGRILKSPVGDGYEINFPSGTTLFVTPQYWAAFSKWYMNLDILRSQGMSGDSDGSNPDSAGLLAPLAPKSWLPAMPDGSSLGAMPATLNQRYTDLYQKFGDAWRVGGNSLFDYAPGTSTATFTLPSWPPMNPPCIAPDVPVAKPMDQGTAASLCEGLRHEDLRANCIVDLQATGEPGFADLFRFSQQIREGATLTTLRAPKEAGQRAVFTATVKPRTPTEGIPRGGVQFLIDGKEMGEPVPLDKDGQAEWTPENLGTGEYQVSARFVAEKDGVFLDSLSFEEAHTVEQK